MTNIQDFREKLNEVKQSEYYRTVKKYLPLGFPLLVLVVSLTKTFGLDSVEYNVTLMDQILRSPKGRAILLTAENQCKIEVALDRLKNGTGKLRYFYYGLLPFGFLIGFLVRRSSCK